MAVKPGGNSDAIKAALGRAAEALEGTPIPPENGQVAMPIATEAANRVAERTCFSNKKDKGLMITGAVIAADGVRRLAQKDPEGKRHWIRGVLQTAVGGSLFSAALLQQRNQDEGRQYLGR